MAGSNGTLLDKLRAQTAVDCDSLDVEVAQALGPFQDCTSNQAIAFGEASKPRSEQLIKDSAKLAKELHGHYEEVSVEELAAEILTIKFSAQMTPHLKGFAHIQTNPYHSYHTDKTVSNAKRVVALYKTICPDFDSSRICIKIPSTWEGIQACRQLELAGAPTLATTLFCMEQVALAGNADCTYIAPYINELKVHFVEDFVDADKGFGLARAAQAYYKDQNQNDKNREPIKTKVLPASLVSAAECMKLAGIDHLTISPPLLAELASTPGNLASALGDQPDSSWLQNGANNERGKKSNDYAAIVSDEAAYRIAFTRSNKGASERKLSEAINIFCDMQDRLEQIVARYM